jgi:transposase
MAGFLREIKRKDKYGKEYSYWVVIKTYRDKKTKKVRHQVLQNFGHISKEEAEKVKALMQLKSLGKEALVTTWEDIKVKDSYDFLIPLVLDKLWKKDWQLDKIIRNHRVLSVSLSLMAEILSLNRAISPDSDYQVSRWYAGTILPTLFKVSSSLVNPTRIYRTLDQILLLEPEIQNHLIKRVEDLGFDDLSLVFYDITSSYFEGWGCPLGEFGLSRDYRKNKLQLLLALAVTKEGFPFYWKVLPGGLHDSITVKEVATSFKSKFQLKDIVLVMDKGMVSKDNLKSLEEQNFPYILTIPRSSVKKLPDFPKELLERLGKKLEEESKKKASNLPVRQADLKAVMEKYPYFTYLLPRAYFHELKKEKKRRYILCFNPEKFLEERKQREKKLSSIKNYLEKWNQELSRAKYTKDKKSLGKEIYHYLAKRKTENLFIIELIPKRKRIKKRTITTYKIKSQIKKDKLESLNLSDGIYCILSNLPEEKTSSFLVFSYRQRRKVEVAFSYLKGFIEIRPFYHQKESRVKAHILLCILGYLLQVTIEYLLKKKGYNISFQEFGKRVETKRAVDLEIGNVGKKGMKLPEIPKDIRALLSAVGIGDKKNNILLKR